MPADQPELGALRRRLLLISSTAVLVLSAIVWTVTQQGRLAAPPRPDLPIGPQPTVASAPVVSLLAPHPDIAGALTPASPEISAASLAEKRTQPALFSTAKVTAVYAGHDVRGVRVQNVGPDSFWHMVGVRSGDVVTDYNGVRIDTPTAMLALLNSMEGDSVIRLRVRGTDEDKRTLYYSAPR